MRNLEEFNQKYKNKKCYILGAGPSLRDFNYDKLNDGLVIAVNSGICGCKIEPNIWLSDDWAIEKWSYFEDVKKLSKTLVFLYDQKLGHTAKYFGDRAVLFKHRLGWIPGNKYQHNKYEHFICQCRTSLNTAICVAHIMGCSPIILLGADCCRLDGKRYFWQFWPKEKQPYRNDNVPIERYKIIKNTKMDTDADLFDILSYWEKFGKEINKKCKVYNASPISLIRCFEKIDFNSMMSY